MALKRYKPLKRKKSLSNGHSLISSGRNEPILREETRKPIPKITEQTLESSKKYSNIRIVLLGLFNICQAALTGCTHNATELHHKRGRGIYKLIIKFMLPVCRSCHDRITEDSDEAMRLGLSISRNKLSVTYLQPHDTVTIRVLIKMNTKFTIDLITN